MFLLSLPWGIDSTVVGCCLVACMLLVFAPGVPFVLLFATGFMSPCVSSSPWVAPE